MRLPLRGATAGKGCPLMMLTRSPLPRPGRVFRLIQATRLQLQARFAAADRAPAPAATPAPPPAPPPPSRGWRSGRRARIATLAVAIAALIAGVVVWAPWTPSPPTAVYATSPTPTIAVISWTASADGLAPDHYLVLRDGTQVGSLPSSATSYTDHGLVPGRTYQYTVIAAGLVNSDPSARATVRPATPSPAGLVTSQVTHTTVTLRWSPPPNAPIPDHYTIYNVSYGQTSIVTTVPGTTTSYTDTGQSAGHVVKGLGGQTAARQGKTARRGPWLSCTNVRFM